MLDTQSTAAELTPLQQIMRQHFTGLRFQSGDTKMAGRKLRSGGAQAVVQFLTGKGAKTLCDARPPAKCEILAWSRRYREWPIDIVSRELQTALYRCRREEYELIAGGFSATDATRQFVLHRLGVDSRGLHAQGLNLIIKNALGIYGGVITRTENANEKKAASLAKKNARLEEEGLEVASFVRKEVTDENGYLLEPPGINPSIYCYQQVSPYVFTDGRELDGLPDCYSGVRQDPDAPIARRRGARDRRAIPLGEIGYVPEWQHSELRNDGAHRRRAPFSATNYKPKPNRRPESPERAVLREQARRDAALLVVIKIKRDWVLIDAQGLLRNVSWRKMRDETLTLRKLLDLFSGDPVIDPVRGIVTFTFKEGAVAITKAKITKTKKAPELIRRLAADGHIGLLSIDLGQTNIVAGRVSRVNDQLKPQLVSQLRLRKELEIEWRRYRGASDQLEDSLKKDAIASLNEDQRHEISRLNAHTPDVARRALNERFGVDVSGLPWGAMSAGTYFIAEAVLGHSHLDPELVHFTNKKLGRLKRTDHNIFRWTRPKLSDETNDALHEKVWALKRASPEYAKLSKRKLELSRRCVNELYKGAKAISRCETVVVIIEDLNVRLFHGGGKRDVGWDHFFERKRENRWLIQVLHKALSELAPHRGIPVIEVNPARTSITCPECNHCDRKSRDGQKFLCVKCGVELHADFEVATRNIEKVALTGQAMPYGEREGAKKKAGGARKRATG